MTDGAPDHIWYASQVSDIERILETTSEGLTGAEARTRLELHGPNVIPAEAPTNPFVVFFRQFASPLILILVVAAGVTLLLNELLDTALIVLALLLNAVIGFAQERRAAGAVRALMQLVVPQCHVVRDGTEQEIDSRDLVVGDLVVLEPGSRLPADLRLSDVNGLTIDESMLTGESLPVSKQADPVAEQAVTADRRSMAFTGTIVTSGRGRGYVVGTALNTELGAIAGQIRVEDAMITPLQLRMQRFARLIGISVLIAAAVAFISGVALGESADTMFHTAVAMAVSAVPEALPVATTVTLAIGVSRMARRNAVLRSLPAIETLGSTTVIGSDKTGTLTENRMTVESIWEAGHLHEMVDGLPASHVLSSQSALHLTLLAGVLTNEAQLGEPEAGIAATGDPTETALLVAASTAGLDPAQLRQKHRTRHEIPFEPELRFSASTREVGDGRAIFLKGAPEKVTELCSHMHTGDGIVPLDPEVVLAVADEMAARGLRVLAMAHRCLDATDPDGPAAGEEPTGLVLAGLQGMMDPPRAGVREAIDSCRDAGLRVVMITGDHRATAQAIAVRLGIVEAAGDASVLTGTDLRDLDHDGLRDAATEVSVFARVSPHDKLRIVRALQAEGHTVAVTGDGVNDAPALRAADLGIAMGRDGTDVAREASDMVLSDDNFVSIVAAVEEGRISFANIRKVSFFLISTAVAETFAILMTVWLDWPLLLVPAQILWLNLVTNGVQDIALAFEPGSPGVLKRPPRPRREGILSAMMWERTLVVGAVMAAGALYMFNWQLERGGSLVSAQSVALTTLVVFNVFHVGNARAENRSIFSLSPLGNRFLFWATIGAVSLHVAALYLPATQFVLRVEPIALAEWLRAILVASSILVVVEVHKAIRRRWPLSTKAERESAAPAARTPKAPS